MTSAAPPATPASPRAANTSSSKRSVPIRRTPGAIKRDQAASAPKVDNPVTPITVISLDKVQQHSSGHKKDGPTSPSARPCRNVLMHGSCSKQGCLYNHNVQQSTLPNSPGKVNGSGRSIHARAPSQPKQPTNQQQLLQQKAQANVNAPIFIPKTEKKDKMHADAPTWTPTMRNLEINGADISRPATQQSHHLSSIDPHSRSFTPDSFGPIPDHHHPRAADFIPSNFPNQNDFQQNVNDFGNFGNIEQPPEFFNPYDPAHTMHQDSSFYNANGRNEGQNGNGPSFFNKQPLYYHLYQPALPHVAAHNPHQLAMNAFFISPKLREDLQKRAEARNATDGGIEIPGYFSLIPLDAPTAPNPALVKKGGQPPPQFFGIRNWVYRAMSEVDGQPYVLRRLEGYRLNNEHALAVVERWRRLRHPGIVSVREAFTTRGFNDASLVFAYDYHPLSNTLYDAHLSPQAQSHALRNAAHHRAQPPLLPERILWSYAIQLCNAIKAVHSNNLAVRTIDLSKILVTGKNRIRINCCSILDVIRTDSVDIPTLQQEDLFDLGKVLLALACNSTAALGNVPRSTEMLTRTYSADVQSLINMLFSKPTPRKSIDDAFAIIGTRILDQLNALHSENDILESEIMREVENGRLVRLLTKFGFINERPEFDHDPRWADSGDRYVIKLFRDYIFHQVDENGRPVVDLSHVLTCLNKLDAGVEERVMLVSRDNQNCLIVSYREVKQAIEGAYRDLTR